MALALASPPSVIPRPPVIGSSSRTRSVGLSHLRCPLGAAKICQTVTSPWDSLPSSGTLADSDSSSKCGVKCVPCTGQAAPALQAYRPASSIRSTSCVRACVRDGARRVALSAGNVVWAALSSGRLRRPAAGERSARPGLLPPVFNLHGRWQRAGRSTSCFSARFGPRTHFYPSEERCFGLEYKSPRWMAGSRRARAGAFSWKFLVVRVGAE